MVKLPDCRQRFIREVSLRRYLSGKRPVVEPRIQEDLVLDLVSEQPSFELLASEWNALNKQSRSGSVFLSWEWHYTWWQVFAEHRDRLHILTWRKDGELVGLLPLYRQASAVPGNSTLRLLGTGEPHADEVASEYGDLLAIDCLEHDILDSAMHHILRFDSWHRVELNCLLADSLLYTGLQASGGVFLSRSAGHRYRLSLANDEASHLASLNPSWVKRVERSRRALAREGGMTAHAIESVTQIERAFRELAELNHERQAHKLRKSVFASERFHRFHLSLCKQIHAKGGADILGYRLDSRLMALLYCFYDEHSCHYYQSGFAKKDANRYMPLTVAHLMEIQRSRESGLDYYDFMRGVSPCYKDEYGCELMPMFNVSVYRFNAQRKAAKGYRRFRSSLASRMKRTGSR